MTPFMLGGEEDFILQLNLQKAYTIPHWLPKVLFFKLLI